MLTICHDWSLDYSDTGSALENAKNEILGNITICNCIAVQGPSMESLYLRTESTAPIYSMTWRWFRKVQARDTHHCFQPLFYEFIWLLFEDLALHFHNELVTDFLKHLEKRASFTPWKVVEGTTNFPDKLLWCQSNVPCILLHDE